MFKGRNGVGFAEFAAATGGAALTCDYALAGGGPRTSMGEWSVGCATLGLFG